MRYRTLALAAGLLILSACSKPTQPTPLDAKPAKASNWVCPTENGFVIRTGADSASACSQ